MTTMLITGAARGIGHVLVQRAIARGDTVFAGVRKQADESRFPKAPNLHVVLLDVSDTASVERGFAEVDRLLAGKPLDAVINPAAISIAGAIELAPVSDFEQTLNTNTLGSLRMIKSAIPRLRGHGGRMIFVTSLWGRASGPMLASYCSSKHAIECIADVARRETMGMDLHVVVVEPGVVLTDMLTSQVGDVEKLMAQMTPQQKGLYGNFYQRYCKLVGGGVKSAISADKCAEIIERPVFASKPKTRYKAGTDSKLVCFLAWLLPDRLMDAMFASMVNHKPVT